MAPVKIVKKKKKKAAMFASKGAVIEQSPYRPYYEEKKPPCENTCPNGEKIREFIQFIAQRENYNRSLDEAIKGAFYIITETNPLPSTTGRICPHPCEGKCNRRDKEAAVNINALEMYIGDYAIENDLSFKKPDKELDFSVAVIGSGPSGLSAAYHLRKLGFKVTIFEKKEKAGGLLRYGIPDFRLPKDILDVEIERIIDLGISIEYGVNIGKTIPLEEIAKKFDATYLAIGAYNVIQPKLKGINEIKGIYSGLEFLEKYAEGNTPEIGENVVVIGADTAADAAMICKRLGANVTFAYRRTIPNKEEFLKTASEEAKQAFEEDIAFQFATIPVELIHENGLLKGVKFRKIEVVEKDERGHAKKIKEIENSDFVVEASTLIYSLGQQTSKVDPIIKITDNGFIKIDNDFLLNKELKIFAGGDAVGPKLMYVTTAIGHGKDAALKIASILLNKDMHKPDDRKIIESKDMHLELYDTLPRQERKLKPPQERIKDFEPYLFKLEKDEFLSEIKRCMSCGMCFDCGNCYTYCSHGCVKKLPAGQHYEFHLETCDGCMKCYENCPCGYISIRHK